MKNKFLGTVNFIFNKKITHKVSLLLSSLILISHVTLATFTPLYIQYASARDKDPAPLKTEKQITPASASRFSGNALSKDGYTPELDDRLKPEESIKPGEIIEKRSKFTEVFKNQDGSVTERQHFSPVFYENGSVLQRIDTSLEEDTNAASGGSIAAAIGKIQSGFKGESSYKTKANNWIARFTPSNDKKGMVRIQYKKDTLTYRPVNAKNVAPVITKDQSGQEHINYYDLWPGVNVEYIVASNKLKLNIVLKDKDAQNNVGFSLEGGTIVENPDVKGGYLIKDIMENNFAISPVNLILNNFGYVGENVYGQKYENGQLRIWADKEYLQKLPSEAFPAVIDPGTYNHNMFGTRAGGDYVSFKTDGTICYSTVCNPYAGSLLDANNVWQSWRSAIRPAIPSQIAGKKIVSANLHLTQLTNAGFWTGNYDTHTFDTYWAPCNHNYACPSYPSSPASSFATVGDINVTDIYRERIDAGETSPWIMITGEECACNTFKNFNPDYSYVDISYSQAPSMASATAPADKSVVVNDQPTLKVNPVSSLTGDQVKYYFRISSSPNPDQNTLVNSGWIDASQWTIPEYMLQDGQTYYWKVYTSTWIGSTMYGQTDPNWVKSFNVNFRTGKDETMTYDTAGPISVALATGNVTTSASTHTMSALGGEIGINLEYNSPLRSKNGLIGYYYSNNSFTEPYQLSRLDDTVNFAWDTGSPSGNVIPQDNFSVRWKGYFIAPETGTYYFGATNDDNFKILINDTVVLNSGCCGTTWSGAVTLQKGQVAKLQADFVEIGGGATAKLLVKGAVSEQVIPSDWLRTTPTTTDTSKGFDAYYYYDTSSHTVPTSTSAAFAYNIQSNTRVESAASAPTAGGPTDNWLSTYEGYLTVPEDGLYTFATVADDAAQLYINGNLNINDWADNASVDKVWGTSVSLTAGQSVPIKITHYEKTGAASLQFLYKKSGISERAVPAGWISRSSKSVPGGWSLGISQGSVAYEFAKINSASVVLSDASGNTHEYKYENGNYTAPKNEYGKMTRNNDGTVRLEDADGRVYLFTGNGKLKEVTSPVDDRKPASLKYEYGGTPARLIKIVDGVDASRFGTIHYAGDPACPALPTGFDNYPGNMICAFKTTDNMSTYFYYKSGQLARIETPGSELTDLGYDAKGQLNAHKSSLANDVVVAGVRPDDSSITSQVFYDDLSRAYSLKMPAAKAGDTRAEHAFRYFVGTNGTGAAETTEFGETEPAGYSQRIEFDNKWRTTKAFDKQGLSVTQEWHTDLDLILSTTDPTALKTTTIYDQSDRAVETYGPAPASWFGTDRKPLPAYTAQVPRSETKYDEGFKGPAITYYEYDAASKSLIGSPKARSTNFNGYNSPTVSRNYGSGGPISGRSDYWGLSSAGKISFPQTGNYAMRIWSDNGVRLYIDDKLVIDDWNDGAERNHPTYTFTNNTANKEYNFRMDYYHKTGNSNISVAITPPGQAETYNVSQFIKPDYGLATSSTVYDNVLGNKTSKTNYTTDNSQAPIVDPNTVYNIYTDGLAANWSDTWSWNSTRDLNNTASPQSGTKAILLSSTSNWGGMNLRMTDGSLQSTAYNSLSFSVRGGQPGQFASVALYDKNWNRLGEQDIEPYGSYISNSEYRNYRIPLSALNGTNKDLAAIEFVDQTANGPKQFYIDNIKFTSELSSETILYDEGTTPHTSIWSWNSTSLNAQDTTNPKSGAKALRASMNGSWGGYALYNSLKFDTTGYRSLTFALRSDDLHNDFSVRLLDESGAGFGPEIPIELYGGVPQSGQYTTYTVPLRQLSGIDRKISGFELQEQWGDTHANVYLDDVKLTAAVPAPVKLYDDALLPDYGYWSWNSTDVNFAATPANSGARAIGVTFNDSWGGFTIYDEKDVNTTDYESLSFTVKGSQAGQNLSVKMVDNTGTAINSGVLINNYGGAPTTTAYKTYTIPLTALGAASRNISGVEFQDELGQPQPKFLIDNIQLNQTSASQGQTQPVQPSAITSIGPEYGIAFAKTSDVGGLDYTTYAAYEDLTDPNGFLRQTESTLPGNTKTKYSYYGETESIDNPCTANPDAVSQAGRSKLTTEQDPDGSGSLASRTKEAVYDISGRVVAARMNNDPWTCTEYDLRSRVTKITQPDINGRPGRTITNTYGIDGNPLKNRETDSIVGSSTSEIDLLGRNVWSQDVWGQTYTVTYDQFGRVNEKNGPSGTEKFTYDNYDRLLSYLLNNVVLSTQTYDQYGRVETITYPEAKDANGNTLKLIQIRRDALSRKNGVVYQTSDGKTYDEQISLSQQGLVTGAVQAYDGQTINSTYNFDGIGRMTSATVGQTKFDYGYGAPDTSCANYSGYNTQAQRNSNRTSFTVTNLANSTTVQNDIYCHDRADRLVGTSDSQVGTPTYDDHGNVVSLSGGGVPITFTYNADDKNIAMKQGDHRVEYVKTASGSVARKKEYTNNTLTKSYRYVAGGSILQECDVNNDNACATIDIYIGLSGGVTLTRSPNNPNPIKQTIYSLKNFHGDTVLTFTDKGRTDSSVADSNRLKAYGPFGENLAAGTLGATTQTQINATDTSMGWAASPGRKVEGGFSLAVIQMGARLYLPSLGRFLQVDPVQGGTLNAYVYAQDPVNGNDYSGLFCMACFLQPAGSAAFLQPAGGFNQQQMPKVSGTLKVSSPSQSGSAASVSRPITVQVTKPVATSFYSWTSISVSFTLDVVGGAKDQASLYGKLLQQGSSVAGRNLKVTSELASNPVVKVIGKYGLVAGTAIEFGANALSGDSMGRNTLKTAGGLALGYGLGAAGAAGCGAAAVASGGIVAPACPYVAAVSGAVGSFLGSRIGNAAADVLGW